ncbi:hypothetical protein QE389_001360 [Brevundimonas sp. SORGH_AS 993]|nr:hypothetical protein [Brevundimonas sp. SORGH_AS_0993]
MAHEGFDPALVVQGHVDRLGRAHVGQADDHARVQEGQFAQPVFQRLEVEIDVAEGRDRGEEGDFGAAQRLARLVAGLADRGDAGDFQRLGRIAALETHLVLFAVAVDLQLQPVGQGVHDRHAHAVQTPRDLVGVLVELTARVQLGHDDLGRRHAFLGVDVGRDAAPVVGHGDGAVGVQNDLDQVGVTGQGLVDGVVHHLIDHVVQARAVVRVPDIHAGAFAHGVQALENLDGIGAVFGLVCNRIGHEVVGSEVPTGTGRERRTRRSNRQRDRTAPKPATYRKFRRKSEGFRRAA